MGARLPQFRQSYRWLSFLPNRNLYVPSFLLEWRPQALKCSMIQVIIMQTGCTYHGRRLLRHLLTAGPGSCHRSLAEETGSERLSHMSKMAQQYKPSLT